MRFALLPKMIVGLCVGLGVGIGIVLGPTLLVGGSPHAAQEAEAQLASGPVVACVSIYTGHARFMYPGQPANCTAGEYPLELGSGAGEADIASRIYYRESTINATAGSANISGVSCDDANDLILGGGVGNNFTSLTNDIFVRGTRPNHNEGTPDGWTVSYSVPVAQEVIRYAICLEVD